MFLSSSKNSENLNFSTVHSNSNFRNLCWMIRTQPISPLFLLYSNYYFKNSSESFNSRSLQIYLRTLRCNFTKFCKCTYSWKNKLFFVIQSSTSRHQRSPFYFCILTRFPNLDLDFS